jgi:hypothetical protein
VAVGHRAFGLLEQGAHVTHNPPLALSIAHITKLAAKGILDKSRPGDANPLGRLGNIANRNGGYPRLFNFTPKQYAGPHAEWSDGNDKHRLDPFILYFRDDFRDRLLHQRIEVGDVAHDGIKGIGQRTYFIVEKDIDRT